MSTRSPWFLPLLVATALFGAAPSARADEGATPTTPAATKDGEEPAEAAAEGPKEAVNRIRGEARKAGPKGGEVVKGLAAEYLEANAERVAKPATDERVPVAILQAMAGRETEAIETLRGAAKDEAAPADARDEARAALVDLSVRGLLRGKDVTPDRAAPVLAEAEETLGAMKGDKSKEIRGALRMQMANLYKRLDRAEDALRHYTEAGADNPQVTPWAARAVVEHYVDHAKAPEDYEKARTSARPVLARFGAALEAALAAAKGRNDERAVKQLEAAQKQLGSAGVPLDLLGSPIPAWTVVHSFKNGASPDAYRGKVVLVDFWATWCPWCIKSFPAMRDLRKEYGEKGFEIVGITTSSGRVFDALWNLDDDVKDKAPADWKPKETLKLDDDASEEAKAEHRKKEREVIATFLSNHEVPWDVVMIEGEEPAGKYGLSGWPYGVLVDRKGRIRRLHAGAILRDDAEGMKEMRSLIESLLAEPADGATTPADAASNGAGGAAKSANGGR
jgi:thiol-disulfide isomerase/thioredoxin